MIETFYHYAQMPLAVAVASILAVPTVAAIYVWGLEGFLLKLLKTQVRKIIPSRDAERLVQRERWLLRLLLLVAALHIGEGFLAPLARLPLEKILNSLFLLLVFTALIKAVMPIFNAMAKRRRGEAMAPSVKYFLTRGTVFLLLFVLAVSLLDLWGVNVTALLGGLGLIGMAAALAAKDSLENIFAGLTIIGSKLFRSGDWIKIGATQGVVEFIGLRVTHIRAFDDSLQFVPNSRLVNNHVSNFGKMRRRRVKLEIGLLYDTTAARMTAIRSRIKRLLVADKEVDDKRTCLVDFTAYGDSAIILSLYYFTVSTKWQTWRDVRNRHIIDFKRIVEEEGSGFAFPTRTVHLVGENEKK